jgi:hypothetical protein
VLPDLACRDVALHSPEVAAFPFRAPRAAILAATLSAVLVLAGCGSSAEPAGPAPSTAATTAQSATTPAGASTKLPKQALSVAREFVRTAVLRTDLARSWALTAPKLRQDLTLQDWLTGNIPVVPFPKSDFAQARYHVVKALSNDVMLEVLMVPRSGSVLQPTRFFMELVPNRSSWLVSYWGPRGSGGGLPGR